MTQGGGNCLLMFMLLLRLIGFCAVILFSTCIFYERTEGTMWKASDVPLFSRNILGRVYIYLTQPRAEVAKCFKKS
jgi:hypothetical protein